MPLTVDRDHTNPKINSLADAILTAIHPKCGCHKKKHTAWSRARSCESSLWNRQTHLCEEMPPYGFMLGQLLCRFLAPYV